MLHIRCFEHVQYSPDSGRLEWAGVGWLGPKPAFYPSKRTAPKEELLTTANCVACPVLLPVGIESVCGIPFFPIHSGAVLATATLISARILATSLPALPLPIVPQNKDVCQRAHCTAVPFGIISRLIFRSGRCLLIEMVRIGSEAPRRRALRLAEWQQWKFEYLWSRGARQWRCQWQR